MIEMLLKMNHMVFVNNFPVFILMFIQLPLVGLVWFSRMTFLLEMNVKQFRWVFDEKKSLWFWDNKWMYAFMNVEC